MGEKVQGESGGTVAEVIASGIWKVLMFSAFISSLQQGHLCGPRHEGHKL